MVPEHSLNEFDTKQSESADTEPIQEAEQNFPQWQNVIINNGNC